MTDPISDYLTRLRNAIKAGHKVVDIPASNLKKEITKILKEKGETKNNLRLRILTGFYLFPSIQELLLSLVEEIYE